MIQAPSPNFVTATTSRTTKVRTAPTALTAALAASRHRPPAASCTTMPAWERVKETKTPIM